MTEQIREALNQAKSRALAWTPDDGQTVTWQMAAAAIIALYENVIHELGCDGCAAKGTVVGVEGGGTTSFHLNKITHRLRFADEDEFSARVIIEPK